MDKEIKKLLNKGEDWKAREDLDWRLRSLARENNLGIISIKRYVKGLEEILNLAKGYLKEFK